MGTLQGAGASSGPSTGAEEPFGKKSKKEKKEKGKENNKLEGTSEDIPVAPVAQQLLTTT